MQRSSFVAAFVLPFAAGEAGTLSLYNCRTGALLACDVEAALTSRARRRGLLGRDWFPPTAALIIAPCRGIHTFFMRFPIDAVFVSKDGQILSLHRAMRPGRIALAARAFAVVELPAGTIDRTSTRCGDVLRLVSRAPVMQLEHPAADSTALPPTE